MAYRGGFGFGFGMTPWVQRLMVANTIIFVAQYLTNGALTYQLAFVPTDFLLRPWTLVTYMFAHGGFMHLFFFGPALEARWGAREFLKFYFICGMGGALLSVIMAPSSSIIGASAAVYGVMLGFAMNWPEMPIYIWGIFPIQARFLVAILAIFSFMSAFQGGGNIAHAAHLGGFAAGFIYLKLDWRRRGVFKNLKKKRERGGMRVVRDSDRKGRARSRCSPSAKRPAP